MRDPAAANATPVRERASLSDWLAVFAGTLGALMALMDVSIVNASLPVIQGEIGATPSEATWVGTAYLVAEIAVIPLTAWLERLLGLRRLLVGGAMLFTAFSVMCGLSSSLMMIIVGRLGQGLAGGVLIPTGMTIVARRLPPAQQSLGLALLAVAALLGPAAGPVLGGWLTENVSWHYAFFINVPICAAQVAMLMLGVDAVAGDWSELRKADWAGIIGMVLGLGGLTTLLEEGDREQWFESALIWRLAAISVIGFLLVAFGQLRARRPVMRLSLLLNNASLASSIALMVVVGALLYGTLYITPQFLAGVAGYNALQAGQICFIAGACAIPTAMCYPLLVNRLDTRVIVGLGMAACGLASYVVTHLTAQDNGSTFILAQIIQGAGTTFCALPLQQVVICSVSVEDSPEANGMMSVARNLGGSIALSAIASFQDERLDFHHLQIGSALAANSADVQGHIAANAAMLGGGPEGLTGALRMIDAQVSTEALVMTFNDLFLSLAVVSLLVLPLVVFLKPIKPGAAPAMGH